MPIIIAPLSNISDSQRNLDSRMKKCKSVQDLVSEFEDLHYIEQEKPLIFIVCYLKPRQGGNVPAQFLLDDESTNRQWLSVSTSVFFFVLYCKAGCNTGFLFRQAWRPPSTPHSEEWTTWVHLQAREDRNSKAHPLDFSSDRHRPGVPQVRLPSAPHSMVPLHDQMQPNHPHTLVLGLTTSFKGNQQSIEGPILCS